MNIDIPLNGGLRTFADSEQIGNDGCTVLKNIDIHIPGKFQTRTIFGDKTTCATDIKRISKWVAPNGTTYWVFFSYDDSKFYLSEDFSLSSDGSLDFTADTQNPKIANYGDYLRLFGDLTKRPQTLHYYPSTRKHFWSMDSSTFSAGFSMSEGIPALDSRFNFSVIQEPISKSTSLYPFGNLDLENKTYYYKVAPIFDGVQEGLLSEILMDTSEISSTNDSTGVISSILSFSKVDTVFDNRLSGLNFYRATESGGPYYKILSASCLSDSDPSLTKVTDLNIGKSIYLSDNTTSFTSKDIMLHGGGAFRVSSPTLLYTGTTESDTNIITLTGDVNGAMGEFNISNIDDPPDNTWVSGQGGVAVLGGTVNYIPSNSDMESGTSIVDESGTTVSTTTDERKYGTKSAKIISTSASAGTVSAKCSLVSSEDDSPVAGWDMVLSFWMKTNNKFEYSSTDSSFSYNQIISIYIENDSGTKVSTIFDNKRADYFAENGLLWDTSFNPVTSVSTGNYILPWIYVMHKFTVPGSGGPFKVIFEFTETASSGQNQMLYIDQLDFYRLNHFISTGTMSYGQDTAISTSLSLDRTDGKKGNMAYLYPTPGNYLTGRVFTAVKANTDKAVQFTSNITTGTAVEMHLGKNYLWRQASSTKYDIVFNDHALNDGISHPLEASSDISVNYKYSQFLDGRNYVANVKFPNAENETHSNWVIYSELNQPDVLPVSNYIEIQDSQGGEILGLGRMLGDLVILMEKGIYRLHTPSTDPGSWSLIESEENTGCVAPDSIIEVEGVLYFAGKDHIYGLDGNFNAVPITKNIQDVWQGTSSKENTKITYDPKLKRLLCQFGGSTEGAYLFHLESGEWTQWEYGNSITADHILVDEDLNINLIKDDDSSLVYDDNVTSAYSASNSEDEITTSRSTGWIKLDDGDDSKTLRRLNIRYNYYIPQDGQDLVMTYEIYTDNSDVTKWTKTITKTSSNSKTLDETESESFRISRRAKNFKINISCTSKRANDTNHNRFTLQRLGVEVD